tara:strand:- start:37195 stop:39006 length:1812 start_codon:yes stop_codon:yes gene_type:complete
MRLATITNWAYGATVALTLVSGSTMLLASNAQERERAAVEQRHRLDTVSAELGNEIYLLSDRARQYLNTGDPTYLVIYRRGIEDLRSTEQRAQELAAAGATPAEVALLQEAIKWAETLHDEQDAAIAAYEEGQESKARQILFGPEYERELDLAEALLGRFQDRLDLRVQTEIAQAAALARLWKTISEIVLAVTGLLFLGVLYFIFRQRVLHPVVRLSDVVKRLAAEDYAVELPGVDQIDEIGDMAEAIHVFRENGLQRQRLETERAADLALRDLLSRMTQRMQVCDTLLDLKEVIRRFVPEFAPSLAGRLYLLSADENEVIEACSWLEPRHSPSKFSPQSCWALRRGASHRPGGSHIDVPCGHLDSDGSAPPPDTLCLPLVAQRETLGLLYVEPREDVQDQGRPPEVYLRMLAENIGLALANLRLRDALREMAMADALTGLPNRRQLDMVLPEQLSDAERLGASISCLMVDVDHFKRFNDRHGHEAGDAVLREVGAVLGNVTRERGRAFRYGGEEFLLLLPEFDCEQAADRAEEIRTRIAALSVQYENVALGPITVSVGVASAPLHCAAHQLVQTADAALLRAKKLGRDRVVMAEVRSMRHAA